MTMTPGTTVVRALICENHATNLILYFPSIPGALSDEKQWHVLSPKSLALHVVRS